MRTGPFVSMAASVSKLIQNEQRIERVQFETDRERIVGGVTLPADGYQSRLSDSLNRDIAFISLVDAEITSLESGETQRRPFMLLSKSHVRIAFPLDDRGDRGEGQA